MTFPAAFTIQLEWPNHLISIKLTRRTRAAEAYLTYAGGFDSLIVRKRKPMVKRRTAVKSSAVLIAV